MAALLRGGTPPWGAFRMPHEEFLRVCRELDLTGLVWNRLRTQPNEGVWPQAVLDALATESRAQTAQELLRQREVIAVLGRLAAEHIDPIIVKGTALAYSYYGSPASRPRVDTDLFIRREHVDPVRRVMGRSGYSEPTHCDGELLFCQFPLKRTDEFGLVHTFDVHWKISTQSVFADVLTFEEIAAAALDLPALGAHARGAGPLHALLLACIHPVMHHRNSDSLVWINDVHLLASQLSKKEFDRFAALAVVKQVSAICAHQLGAARTWLGTRIPDSAMTILRAAHLEEPSAAYLRPNRRWRHELMSCVWGLPCWRDRLRLLREVTLPSPTYMLQAYGLSPSWRSTALLPVLHLHRLSSGGWKVLLGRK